VLYIIQIVEIIAIYFIYVQKKDVIFAHARDVFVKYYLLITKCPKIAIVLSVLYWVIHGARVKFDDTDVKVLRNLQKDARTNFADIAKECNVSVDTIIKRLHRLQMNGVVKGTTILLEPKLMGMDCLASLEVNVDAVDLAETVEAIKNQPGIVFCTFSMGMQNIFAIAVLRNMKELNILREFIKGLTHVKELKTSIWVDDVLLCPENFELEKLKENR
jgi:Lrp/AsnC family leucine-responsive transcriptional regulator